MEGRDREECLGVARVGILGRKLLPWAWMPGLLLAAIVCLYGEGLCLSPFLGVRLGSLSEDCPWPCRGFKDLPSAVTAAATSKVLTIIPHTRLTTHHPHGYLGSLQLQLALVAFKCAVFSRKPSIPCDPAQSASPPPEILWSKSPGGALQMQGPQKTFLL